MSKEQIKQTFALISPELKRSLPNHIPVEKFIRVSQTAILTNKSLMSLDRASLFLSCQKAAEAGLLPDGAEGAIVPFKGKAVFMPMIKGLLKLVRNSGELESLSAHIVHENDEFKYWIDEHGEHIYHVPLFRGERGAIESVYSRAKTKDGGIYIEIMTIKEIEKVRNSSRAKNSGPWSDWWEEMAKKTVIRRMIKRLPMSTDLDAALQSDNHLYEKPPIKEVKAEESVEPSNLLAQIKPPIKAREEVTAGEEI